MTTIYIARAGRDYDIASTEIIKETPQGYRIDSNAITKIHGNFYWLPSRLDKNTRHYTLFTSLDEAYTWCLTKMQDAAQELESQLFQIQRNIAALETKMR